MRKVAIYYLLAVAVIAGVVGMTLVPARTPLSALWFMATMFSLGGLFVVAGFDALDAQSPTLAWSLVIMGMLFVLVAIYEVNV
jgi:hypothetical protein